MLFVCLLHMFFYSTWILIEIRNRIWESGDTQTNIALFSLHEIAIRLKFNLPNYGKLVANPHAIDRSRLWFWPRHLSLGPIHCFWEGKVTNIRKGTHTIRQAQISKGLVLSTYLEFHWRQLIHNISHGISNHIPCDFIFRLCRWLDSMTGHIVKGDDIL